MSEPSIKGSTFAAVVNDLQSAVESGLVRSDVLEACLEPSDLAYLEPGFKISSMSWYPIESYRRIVDMLLEHVGNSDPAYLVKRGADAAVRLNEAGLYQQIEYVGRINETRGEHEDVLVALKRQLRLIVTLARSIYNFSEWDADTDPEHEDRLRIVVSDAAAMPENSVLVIQGFINQMSEFSDSSVTIHWSGARVGSDRIVYSMSSSIKG